MQLNIAICDDKENDCQALESMLHTFCASRNVKMHSTLFFCGEDFLESHHKNTFDIIFMDIYMPGISGIDAVRNARQKNQCQFIFTTVSREHAMEAFGLNAAHYLLKPLTEASVGEAMERCLSRLGKSCTRHLEIKTKRGMIPVPTENIVYIEVFNKICTIHTNKNCFQTYSSLNALFALLDETSFMRAQQSFVVNMCFIDSFFFDHVVLKDGTKIVLSRNRRAKLKEQYQQFLFQLARRGNI